MTLSFFLILLPGLPVKNSLPVEQTHSANIISFSIYENENEPRLDDFLPLFVCFGTKIFSQHQTSTARFRLAEENGQHRPFPSLACVLPHPLQNRVPRVQVLLPLPKKSGIAAAVPDFFVSEQKDLAARCARRPACGACSGGLQPGGLRPGPTEAAAETSPSHDFLLAFRSFLSVRTCSQPFSSPPAPKTHPVSPFSG